MKKVSFIFVLFAVAFLLCSCSTVKSQLNSVVATEEPGVINVSGTGSVTVKADMVSFTVSVSETAETTGLAQQKTNKKISSILSILRSFGIKEEDITTTSLNFSTEYYWEDGHQIKAGEEVSQSLYIKMKDIDRFALLIDNLGSEVSGISFYNVSFGAEDYTEAYRTARQLAYTDALEKAQIYAQSANMEVGRPINISDNYTNTSQVRYSNSDAKYAMAAESAFYGTEVPAGNLSVTVSCSIVFELR